MSCKYDLRVAVLEAFRAKRSAQEIIQFFSYPKIFVDNPDEVRPDQKQHKRRSDAERTEEFVENLHEKTARNSSQSMGNLAEELRYSKSTIHLSVYVDFG